LCGLLGGRPVDLCQEIAWAEVDQLAALDRSILAGTQSPPVDRALGLVENTQGHTKRLARAWRLTADGEAVIYAHRGGRALVKAQRRISKGGKLVAPKSGRRGKHQQIAAAGTEPATTSVRMTALTHEVLTTVANLSAGESNPSNREIATAVKVKDEGQISKLLTRLQTHGLLENAGGPPKGANAWRLTSSGEELLSASRSAT
jgi:hypothetical protein